MSRTEIVELFSAYEGDAFKVEAEVLRRVAKQELGMIEPVEITIFTKTILATALQREQIVRNDLLQQAMNAGGDWKTAMRNVAAVTELMEKYGIEDAKWSPNGQSAAPVEKVAPPVPPEVPKGKTVKMELDGQSEMPF